jgi:hypothetical protein
MRLWSVHPKYLDKIGLTALWREALLAQKVLKNETKAYKNHPQLKRFRNHPNSQVAIVNYLTEIWKEAKRRDYNFNNSKIGKRCKGKKIPVTCGQLEYEFDLLRSKLRQRDCVRYQKLRSVKNIESHPSFKVITGDIEEWEKTKISILMTEKNWR